MPNNFTAKVEELFNNFSLAMNGSSEASRDIFIIANSNLEINNSSKMINFINCAKRMMIAINKVNCGEISPSDVNKKWKE